MFCSEGRHYDPTAPSWDSGTSEWNREPVPWVTPKLNSHFSINHGSANFTSLGISFPPCISITTNTIFLPDVLFASDWIFLRLSQLFVFPLAEQFGGLYYQQGPSQLAPILELCHGYLIRVWKWQNRSRSPFAPLPLLCMLCPPGTSLASGRQQDLLWTYILHGNLSVRWHCDWDLGSERGW